MWAFLGDPGCLRTPAVSGVTGWVSGTWATCGAQVVSERSQGVQAGLGTQTCLGSQATLGVRELWGS